MLEKVDLRRKLPKKHYKIFKPYMRARLYDLQKACWDAHVPSIIVFEGWDAAGKGSTISLLTSRLDPRGFRLHPIQAPRTLETQLPWLWRFWIALPNYGEMAIFDRSWYGRVLVERVEGLAPESQWRRGYRDIRGFERTLADDGYVLMKFFLHIDSAQQAHRFEMLERDPLMSWHVQPEDWQHHRNYDQYVIAIEEMLEHTEAEWGPWTIVEATDRRWASAKVFQTIIRRLEDALVARGHELPEEPPGFGDARDIRQILLGGSLPRVARFAAGSETGETPTDEDRVGPAAAGDEADTVGEGAGGSSEGETTGASAVASPDPVSIPAAEGSREA